MKKTVIITGASKGIGKACAQLFLTNDWQVINMSRSPCALNEVHNIAVDFLQLEDLTAQQTHLEKYLQRNDQLALIHNAAYFNKDAIQDINADKLRQNLAVNVIAPMALNQIVLPFMKSGSAIVYIGSTLSEKAVANTASYTIAKHSVVGMMRSTCQDLADTGIHTCCICPGFTNTEMLRHHVQNNDEILNMLAQRVGANRLIDPTEIAGSIYYAATNPVINGAVIHANLGQIEN